MHRVAVVAVETVRMMSRGCGMTSRRIALVQLGPFVRVRDLCIADLYSHTALPTPMRR